MSPKRIFLIIAPHPDDAELGLGGTIIKLKKAGHKVFIIDLTSGEPTPYGTEKIRRKETLEATRILKIDERINLGLENRYLLDNKKTRLLLAEKIRIYRPDVLFCPYPEDAHPDHIASTKITESARFYAKYTRVKEIRGKPCYPSRLFYYFCTHLRTIPKVSFLIDISKEFKAKMRAIRCYRSQFIDNPRNRFIFDYVRTQNKFLGNLIFSQYAEAFYSREVIKIKDLPSLL